MQNRKAALDRISQLLTDEDDGRACKDIPDDACTALPRNFLLLLLGQTASALADLLSNPKTVLTWLLSSLGAPAALVAWLVPVRESGAMLPQMLLGAWVRRFAKRKRVLVLGGVLQAICLIGMAFCALTLQGYQAGIAILMLLLLFSLARGLNSIATKDVTGKTIPKGRRGRLSGLSVAISAALTAFVAIWLLLNRGSDTEWYALLLIAAALLWCAAALSFTKVTEQAGATEGGRNAFLLVLQNTTLVARDAVLRRFIFCRAMLLSSALVQPFIVLLAQQQLPSGQMLAVLLLASSLATAISAPLWGRLADNNSKKVLRWAAIVAAVVIALAAATSSLVPTAAAQWYYPLLFIGLHIAHAGIRLGRKTYILDIATGDTRTDYVAVSNSIIGLCLLLTGLITAALASVSIAAVLWFFTLCSVVGAIAASRLKAVPS